ncbi:hypothetical protein F4804DRAFT_281533 [Jackrogersella minutella]|nr:hypothetical protein F4804DRAFT_281533 [Jackrogersella minutella]
MAVLQDVPGVEVTVEIAGRDAVEYDDPDAREQDSTKPTSSKYIECIDGAKFGIKMVVTEGYEWGYKNHSLSARSYVDGNFIISRVISRKRLIDGRCVYTEKGNQSYCAQTRQWRLHECKFSAVTTIDDAKKDRVEKDLEISKNLGVIKVEFYRCINHGYKETDYAGYTKTSHKDAGYELSEKSLKGKAISHGTSFSEPKHMRAPAFVRTVNLDEDNGPIAVFQFHYRSRDALKREMIIPRSPSPADPDIACMSRAELERLAEERLNQLRQDGSVKEERKPIVKRERGQTIDLSNENTRPAKSRRPVEIIDLTDD